MSICSYVSRSPDKRGTRVIRGGCLRLRFPDDVAAQLIRATSELDTKTVVYKSTELIVVVQKRMSVLSMCAYHAALPLGRCFAGGSVFLLMSLTPVCDNRQETDTDNQTWIGGVNYPLTIF